MDTNDDEFPPDLVDIDGPDLNNTSSDSSSPDRIVPITLLTGYLGSGKTTLLNHILQADHGYRIAVCMNDFGDSTDIESTAMTFTPNPTSTSSTTDPAQPETTFLSLPNGCLCCSIKEPGIAAIENMIERQSQSDVSVGVGEGQEAGKRGIDRVVVELTGVADPAEIARSFWTNEEMGGKLKLDGVVCVVDSRNVMTQLEEGEECQKQIAASDVILLNKMDLVTNDHLDLVERRIRTINPTAMFKHTHRSIIDIGQIFEIGGYSVASTLDVVDVVGRLEGRTMRERIEALSGGKDGHDHREHEHGEGGRGGDIPAKKHLEGISSLVIDLPVLPSDSLDRLDAFLRSIHWDSALPTSEPVASSSSAVPRSTGAPSRSFMARVDADRDDNDDDDDDDTTQSPTTTFEILRTKGIFTFDAPGRGRDRDRETYVLQGVRDIFELNRLNTPSLAGQGRATELVRKGGGDEAAEAVMLVNRSKLVVIGKRLGDRETWIKALEKGLGL